MKTFHILPKASQLPECFTSSHYLDLPNGNILLCGEFIDASQEARFKAQPSVLSLPHPLSRANVMPALAQEHLAYLASIGVSITGNDSTFDLSEKLKGVHGGMQI
jgi:hypothetical protein